MTVEGAGRTRRRDLGFWVQIGVFVVLATAFGFVANVVGDHDSAGTALFGAAALAFALGAYQVGYREGRKDYEHPHPATVVPPPKQR